MQLAGVQYLVQTTAWWPMSTLGVGLLSFVQCAGRDDGHLKRWWGGWIDSSNTGEVVIGCKWEVSKTGVSEVMPRFQAGALRCK